MFPVLFHIGPVSFTGFLIFSIILLTLYFFIIKAFHLKKTAKNDFLWYVIFFITAAFILMLTKKSFPLRTYGLMTAAGFFAAIWFVAHQGKKIGIPVDVTLNVGVISLICGILGARIFYIIFFNWHYYMQNPGEMIAIWHGGQVLYGGIIFAGIADYIYLKKKKINLIQFFDLAGIAILIGIGFGRWGCFGYGCCYGKPGHILGVEFPKGSPAYLDHLEHHLITPLSAHSLPVIPTQILSSLNAFFLAFILFLIYKKHKKFDGEIIALSLILYAVTRFLIEYLRVNPVIVFFTAAQWTAIAMVILGIYLWYYFKKRNTALK